MRRILKGLGQFYDARGALLWGAAALMLIVLVLYGGRTIGLADNGDFKRVMDASSLTFTGNEAAYTYSGRYKIVLGDSNAAGNVLKILFGSEGYDKYPSLQVPLTRISVAANLVINKVTGNDMTVYRLEVLGVMYALLHAAAIGFLAASFRLPRRGLDVAAKAAILLVLCDVGYLAYFNSFYGEALQLSVFVFLAALLVRIFTGTPGVKEAVWSALGCAAFGWVKFFNIPAACVFLVLLEGLILLRTQRKAAILSGVAGLAVLAAVWLSVPSWMGIQTKFNAVFFGALRGTDAATAEKYLGALGLPPELAKYRDMNIYVEGVALELEQNGYDTAVGSVSEVRLGLFYLGHPDIFLRSLDVTRLNAGSIRPDYLGNYDASAPKLTLSHRFSAWSDARSALGFDTWVGIAGVTLAFGITLYMALRRAGLKPGHCLIILLLLAGTTFYFFAGPFISNGEGDLAKHLFACAQMMDLMVLYVLSSALYALGVKGRRAVAQAGLCALLALTLLASPVKAGVSEFVHAHRTHEGLETGAYVEFGSYHNEGLVWYVSSVDDTAAQSSVISLVSVRTIGNAAFAHNNSNAWASSTLRSWLNGDFLQSFSSEERARLVPLSHAVLLTRETKSTATAGSGDFYFSQVPELASRGYASAYQITLRDKAALPDADLISELARSGENIALAEAYWLDTPYFNNGYMVRCVMPNGIILMREAQEASGVRPVIRVEAAGISGGDGSCAHPFILE